VRFHFGIASFGVSAWTGHAVGDRIVNEHDEADEGQEELYFVASGRARFELDGEQRDAPAGTFVHVLPGVRRTAFAEEPETTLLVVGGTPGKAYEVSDWEVWAPLKQAYEEGRYDEVIERARALLAEHPDSPLLLYNLACCEALAGRPTDAIEHLRQATERGDRFREYAKTDSDLDSLRGDPAFDGLL
jgi:hypothetical protein